MNQKNWQNLSKGEQIAAIAAEIKRAEFWEKDDREKFNAALERALNLVDETLNDRKWQKQIFMLLYLREEFAKFYIDAKENIGVLCNSL